MRLSNRDWIVVGVIFVTALAAIDTRYGQSLRLPSVIDSSAIQRASQGFKSTETPRAQVVGHLSISPSGAGALNLSNPMGSVSVRGTNAEQVTVAYTMRVYGGNESKAREFLSGLKVEASRSGDELLVRRTSAKAPRGVTGLTVDYRIEIPKSLKLVVDNHLGSLEAFDLGSSAHLHNSFGRLLLARATGNCQVETKYGEADVQGVKGNLLLDGSFGKVWVRDVTGSLDAKARYGAFGADGIGGNLKCSASYGDLQARRIGGDVDVDSRYSAVRVESLGGKAVVTSRYGAVTLTGLRQSATVSAKGGRVELGLKNGVGGFSVHAAVTRGNFLDSTSQTEPFVEEQRHSLSSGVDIVGKTGQGEHQVKVEANMGDVALTSEP